MANPAVGASPDGTVEGRIRHLSPFTHQKTLFQINRTGIAASWGVKSDI